MSNSSRWTLKRNQPRGFWQAKLTKTNRKKIPIMIIKIQKILTQQQDKVKIKCAAVDEQD